jgi:hypothetical protein
VTKRVSVRHYLNHYKEISQEEATRILSDHYPRGVIYQLEKPDLPDSLQKVDNLAAAFISGVSAPVTAAPKYGKPETVIFVIRNDIKDAPETGNINAHLLLRVDEKVLMSPPCKKLTGAFPHHFSGAIPISGAFK